MRRVLCVWLPNWPIQRRHAGLGNEPAAALDRPFVLLRRDPRRGQFVIACCDRASALGVRRGMSTSLVPECLNTPHEVAEHQPWDDYVALMEIATRCLKHFSPHVALEPLAAKPWAGQWLHQPDTLFLDVRGITPLFGGETEFVAALVQQFEAWKLKVHVALASAVGTAWALAHYRARRDMPVLAPPLEDTSDKTSSDKASETLNGLPLAALRLPAEIIESLERLGIGTLGALQTLPREGLLQRFDAVLLERLDQALGIVDEPLEMIQEQPVPEAEAELDCPTRDREIIQRGVETLLEKVVQRLGSRQQGVLRLECRFSIEDRKEPMVMELGLFAPTAHASHLCRLMLGMLERRALPGAVTRLAIHATLLGTLRERQMGLLPDALVTHTSGGPLSRFIDQLAGRLGRDRVLGVRLITDHQPECAFELVPLVGQAIAPSGKSKRTRKTKSKSEAAELEDPQRLLWWGPSAHEPLRRPLELYASPQSIDMVLQADSEQIEKFRWHGDWYRVHRFWGPERIETGWWRGASVRRCYYRIETHEGSWWWLFQCLSEKRWFLHGRFA